MRHRSHRQRLCQREPPRNETFITAAGHTIRVPQALDEIMRMLAPNEGVSSEGGEQHWPF